MPSARARRRKTLLFYDGHEDGHIAVGRSICFLQSTDGLVGMSEFA